MSNNFGLFLLFSVLVTGLMISPVFAQEPPVNATETMTESNSTATGDESMIIEDEVTITEDEMVNAEDEMMAADGEITETEEVLEAEIIPTIPSPLKQIKEGTMPESVICKEGLGLVFKLNGQPACVKTTSIEKLIAWGWAK